MKAKRKCPVVAVTAHVDESILKKAEAVGMKQVLNKPLFIEPLSEVIEKYYYQ